jgi:hypothetical protein
LPAFVGLPILIRIDEQGDDERGAAEQACATPCFDLARAQEYAPAVSLGEARPPAIDALSLFFSFDHDVSATGIREWLAPEFLLYGAAKCSLDDAGCLRFGAPREGKRRLIGRSAARDEKRRRQNDRYTDKRLRARNGPTRSRTQRRNLSLLFSNRAYPYIAPCVGQRDAHARGLGAPSGMRSEGV